MFQFKSIQEILEFAITKEQAAQKLYANLAERLTDPMVRKLFADLALEEVDHRQQLELELMKLGRVVPESNQFKGARVTECTISDDIPPAMGYAEALVLAMQKEKAAFRLYVEMVSAPRPISNVAMSSWSWPRRRSATCSVLSRPTIT